MSAAAHTVAAPGGEVPLACHTDPDQWFDSGARTAALAECLACPHRRWCAQRALKYQPRWGMWAGIWIPGRFDAVKHFFDAVAADTALPHPPNAAARPAPAAPARQRNLGIPRGVPGAPSDPIAPAALVWARASGHCEIMSTGCRLAASTVSSRIPDRDEEQNTSALFAVCAPCADTLQDLDPHIARRLGYRVDNPVDTEVTPFFWRQRYRMVLSADGALHDTARPDQEPYAVAT